MAQAGLREIGGNRAAEKLLMYRDQFRWQIRLVRPGALRLHYSSGLQAPPYGEFVGIDHDVRVKALDFGLNRPRFGIVVFDEVAVDIAPFGCIAPVGNAAVGVGHGDDEKLKISVLSLEFATCQRVKELKRAQAAPGSLPCTRA